MTDDRLPDEPLLIENSLAGDASAFRSIIARHQRQVYAVAYALMGNHDDADDVAQETFVLAYRHLASFRREAALSTWLHRIAANTAQTMLRRRRRHEERHSPLDESAYAHPADEPRDDDAERIASFERHLHELPTMQRAVVILRHLQGRSTRQVSAVLGISEGTVKTHLHRGLLALRAQILGRT